MQVPPSLNTTTTQQNTNNNTSIPPTPPRFQFNPSQTNEKDVGIFINNLVQNIDEYRYNEDDDINDIKSRIRRCIKLAKMNKFKKADAALNPSKIADLNKPEIWRSLLSKYPDESPLIMNDNINIQPQYRLDRATIIKIIQNLNKQSCGGPGGLTNELLIWMAEKEGDCDIAGALNHFARTHICKGLPIQMRKLLMYAKGVAFLKERKNDVRPVCIISSIIRLLEKIVVENIPQDTRRGDGPISDGGYQGRVRDWVHCC